MATTRTRFGSILEWLLAAAVIAAAIVGVSFVLHEIRTGSTVPPVAAVEAPPPEAPPSIPPGSVSVPLLLLADGKVVHLGDDAEGVTASLGADAEVPTEPDLERVEDEGLMRFYNYAGTRFVLVFKAATRDTQPRVTAIYVQ